MDVKGKKVAFLGDSITEGVGASSVHMRFTDVFAALSGSISLNYGISGTRIAEKKDKSQPIDYQDFSSRVSCISTDAEVIVVFGGTNDFGHGDAPIGEFDDRTTFSFYGALHVLCTRLLTAFPYSTIVFMTPLHRIGENEVINEYYPECPPLSRFVDAIREVCEYYSIPVLDLFKTSGIQPEIPKMRSIYMPDGLHPSDLGAQRVAERLYGFLREL